MYMKIYITYLYIYMCVYTYAPSLSGLNFRGSIITLLYAKIMTTAAAHLLRLRQRSRCPRGEADQRGVQVLTYFHLFHLSFPCG